MDAASPCAAAEPFASRQFRCELRRWRVRRGLTQRALAERIRFSRETVAAVESGRRYGSCEFAVRCDEALSTDGRLAALWPRVAVEQLAADGRRGPRGASGARRPPPEVPYPSPPDTRTGPPGAGPRSVRHPEPPGVRPAARGGSPDVPADGWGGSSYGSPGAVPPDPNAVVAAIDELRELVGRILHEQAAGRRPSDAGSPLPARPSAPGQPTSAGRGITRPGLPGRARRSY